MDIDEDDNFSFEKFRSTRAPLYTTTNSNRIQEQNAARLMAPNRDVFQRLHVDMIDYPGLWTQGDEERARTEGWAIGNMWSRLGPASTWQATPCIGKIGGTFVSDADAHAWVAHRSEAGTGMVGVYKRALAVVAALTLRYGS
jgi:hypothetical protein